MTVVAEGRRLAVVHTSEGFVALDNECTHMGGPLGEGDLVGDCSLRCPWHGAVFDVRTGAVLDGPAPQPTRTYPTAFEDGVVAVTIGSADAQAERRAKLAALRAARAGSGGDAGAETGRAPRRTTGRGRGRGQGQ